MALVVTIRVEQLVAVTVPTQLTQLNHRTRQQPHHLSTEHYGRGTLHGFVNAGTDYALSTGSVVDALCDASTESMDSYIYATFRASGCPNLRTQHSELTMTTMSKVYSGVRDGVSDTGRVGSWLETG